MALAADPRIGDGLRQAGDRFGTPVYVTDVGSLDRAARTVTDAFPDPWIRQFSLKANDVPAIVQRIGAFGFGANVVSGGEWALATQAGIPNARVTLEGVGKSDADLHRAVDAVVDGRPLRWLALESAAEAAVLAGLAAGAGLGTGGRPRLNVLLRLNPAVEPETSAALAVGTGSSKFGLLKDELEAAVAAGGGAQGPLRWRGLQIHIGSQLTGLTAWRHAVGGALNVLAALKPQLPDVDTLDIGGGFPSAARGDGLPTPVDFAQAFERALAEGPRDRPARLAIEPGRFLTARAGWIVARVLHARPGRGPAGEALAVIDAGMTELIRPALYGARHDIIALTSLGKPVAGRESGAWFPTFVEGPICESTDRLGSHNLPALQRGDLVAIADAGAYASSMSSRYNGRLRAPEILLEVDGTLQVGRDRGSEDLR
jgi:diaminopimelate decarboxylase